jgi:hypothetical protein
MGRRLREGVKSGQPRWIAGISGPPFGVVRLSEPSFVPLARFGPTTPKPIGFIPLRSIRPKRATTSLVASVDPTDARYAKATGIVYVRLSACRAVPKCRPAKLGRTRSRASGGNCTGISADANYLSQTVCKICCLDFSERCREHAKVPKILATWHHLSPAVRGAIWALVRARNAVWEPVAQGIGRS